MSWPWIALLVAALGLVIGAEWSRVSSLLGADARRSRERKRRKATLRVIRSDADEPGETDDFAESVRRDLDALPTIEERDRT